MTADVKAKSSSDAFIELHELDLVFGRHEVLREITLSVPRGQTLAVIGESGCGKTVLLKMIIGLLRPTSGHVVFDGERMDQLSDKEITALRSRLFRWRLRKCWSKIPPGQTPRPRASTVLPDVND